MKAYRFILIQLSLALFSTAQEAACQEPGAQNSIVSAPEILVSALPTEAPEGYVKLDQWIDTGYYSPAFVFVRYTRPVRIDTGSEQGVIELASVIEVSIGDHAGFTTLLEPAIRVAYSYEKRVRVRGLYDGREAVFSGNNLCTGAEKIFIVKDRYLVNLNSSYMCDMSVLDRIIERMDLGRLR